ncbi:MAG: hypothetical protein Q9220_004213 [cf. Caloplaca sp. 1 TL-2023]
MDEHHFQSAADYLRERSCNVQYPSYILHHHLVISPLTTRDDLPFPQPEDEYRSRDVNLSDWNTFLNYLMPYDTEPTQKRGRIAELGSKDGLKTQNRIQAVLDEWQEGFFGPRGIHIESSFTANPRSSATPPPPFTSTADVGHYPDASSSTYPVHSLPSRPSQPPAPHGRSMPPQGSAQSQGSPLHWARNTITGSRFASSPLARLLSGTKDDHSTKPEDLRSRRERHRHEMRERRGRSSSSSSSDSSAGGRHHQHRGGKHERRDSSTSSSSSGSRHRGPRHRGGGPWGGRGRHHHGHGKHHHHRSSSSSSSSSSSDASIASFSSSDFSGADVDQVRHSIATMRQNPAHFAAAVRQFKNDLHQSRRQHHDMARGMRGGSHNRGYKHELKAQRKEMKAELKGFIREVRVMRKADRKIRRYERKSQRAHRKAERKGVHAHAKGQRKLAKVERKALKAQRKAVEVTEQGRVRSMEAEGRMGNARREDLIWEAPDEHLVRGGVVNEQERGVIPETKEQTRNDDGALAARTRLLGMDGTVRREKGVGVGEG